MEQVICVICHDALFGDEQHIIATKCSHCFHESCLESWKAKSIQTATPTTCPECRTPLKSEENRRMFFRLEKSDENPNLQMDFKQQIFDLQNAMTTLKRQYESQLHAEVEIRQELHKKIKKMEAESQRLGQPQLIPVSSQPVASTSRMQAPRPVTTVSNGVEFMCGSTVGCRSKGVILPKPAAKPAAAINQSNHIYKSSIPVASPQRTLTFGDPQSQTLVFSSVSQKRQAVDDRGIAKKSKVDDAKV